MTKQRNELKFRYEQMRIKNKELEEQADDFKKRYVQLSKQKQLIKKRMELLEIDKEEAE